MLWKRFSSDITAIEGPTRIPVPVLHSRFEPAWKEYARLDNAAHGRGPIRWVRGVFEALLVGGGGLGLKFGHQHRALVGFLWVASAGIGVAYLQIMKSRFAHWQCPRCQTEWPGTKNEKDSRCSTCGLRLHELA